MTVTEPQIICDARTGYMPGLLPPDFMSKREEVRWKVRHLNLCALDRETRRAAAADPAIVWCAEERQYRFRRKGDVPCAVGSGQYLDPGEASNALPPPPPAKDGGAEREGVSESSRSPNVQTGARLEYERKAHFHGPCGGSDDR
ncbi:hypothetical protein [Sphingomonas sp.]|uniref:hypothetical protein n=1 Tax=Sphingomonas sp. TaxID=28214 RepID=UPI0035BBE9CE